MSFRFPAALAWRVTSFIVLALDVACERRRPWWSNAGRYFPDFASTIVRGHRSTVLEGVTVYPTVVPVNKTFDSVLRVFAAFGPCAPILPWSLLLVPRSVCKRCHNNLHR